MNDTNSVTIKTEPVPCCPLCGEKGAALYQGLRDHLFGVSGEWSLKRCINPDCGLVWLDPRPVLDDIGKLYAQYSTHTGETVENQAPSHMRQILIFLAAICGKGEESVESFVKSVRATLSAFGPRRELTEASLMWLTDNTGGKLLDVGCGNGQFLRQMRDRGWEVAGVEPDPKAVQFACEEYGLDIRQGALADAGFLDNTFDAVTLSHVIEHVPDPVGLLKECRRVLKPGGKLVLTTPNIDSLGHMRFGLDWRGLEPPRHFQIYSKSSLSITAVKSGFKSFEILSIARLSTFIWNSSRKTRQIRTMPNASTSNNLFYNLKLKMVHKLEYCLCRFKSVGEEVVLIGTK